MTDQSNTPTEIVDANEEVSVEDVEGYRDILIDRLKASGMTGTITISFYGGGDEGQIEDIEPEPVGDEDLLSDLRQWADAASILPGIDWWNNDGGDGSLEIDLDESEVRWVINVNVIEQQEFEGVL